MPDLAKINHELSQEKFKHVVYIVGRFLRIIHYGKTIQQNLRDEYN